MPEINQVEVGERFEKLLNEATGKKVWVPGVQNGALGGMLEEMAKLGWLDVEVVKQLGLAGAVDPDWIREEETKNYHG